MSDISPIKQTNNDVIQQTMPAALPHEAPPLPDARSRPFHGMGSVVGGMALKVVSMLKDQAIVGPRMSNPDLLEEDKALLSRYEALMKNGEDVSDIKKEVIRRYAELFVRFYSSYTGREDVSWVSRNVSAFEYAADSLGVFDEKEFEDLGCSIHEQMADPADVEKINAYKADPTEDNKKAVLEAISKCSKDLLSSVWGTSRRKMSVLRSNALQGLAIYAGIPEKEVLFAGDISIRSAYEKGLPMFNALEAASGAMATPEKYDDFISLFGLADVYGPVLNKVYSMLESNSPDVQEISTLSGLLMHSRESFEELGGDPAQLDLQELMCREKIPFNNNAERDNGVEVYSPDQLPEDIKSSLSSAYIDVNKTVNGLDFVNRNVRRIVFVENMPDKELTDQFAGQGAVGMYVGNGIVVMMKGGDPKLTAMTLLHEAAHANWERDTQVPIKVRDKLTLNEGNAYFTELLVEKNMGLLTGQNMSAASVADLIGSVDFKDPGDDALKLDLSVYPTKTPMFVSDSLALPLSLSFLEINGAEKEALKGFVEGHGNICGMDEEKGGVVLGNMNEEDKDSLVRLLPGRKKEIEEIFANNSTAYRVHTSVVARLLGLDLDMDELSSEVSASLEGLKQSDLKDSIEKMYPSDMDYSDIGRMLYLMSLRNVNVQPERFESVFSVLLPHIDKKYSSVPYARAVELFKKDASKVFGSGNKDVSAYDLLTLALFKQPGVFFDREKEVPVYDAKGKRVGDSLRYGTEYNELIEPEVKMNGKKLIKIRYVADGDIRYGYVNPEDFNGIIQR